MGCLELKEGCGPFPPPFWPLQRAICQMEKEGKHIESPVDKPAWREDVSARNELA
jgi:hypothetical protein